jgi:hypothetical protein
MACGYGRIGTFWVYLCKGKLYQPIYTTTDSTLFVAGNRKGNESLRKWRENDKKCAC